MNISADSGLTWIKERVELKFFYYGLGAVALLYVLIFITLGMKSEQTVLKLEEKLASKTVLIEKPHKELPKQNHESASKHGKTSAAEHHEPSGPTIPLEGLFDSSHFGPLPKIRTSDNLTPFNAYKKPFVTNGKPTISLIINDYGLSKAASKKILAVLPNNVTLLISPYSKNAIDWQKKARKADFETWLNIPFENESYPLNDPGPQALLTTASLRYNEDKLKWNLGHVAGYAGIASYTDEIFVGSRMMLTPLIDQISGRGIAFLELNNKAPKDIKKMMQLSRAPYLKADVIINGLHSDKDRQSSPLKALERIAKEQGSAVGILHPYVSSLDQISVWLDSLPAKGFELVPVSAIAPELSSIITPDEMSEAMTGRPKDHTPEIPPEHETQHEPKHAEPQHDTHKNTNHNSGHH